MCAPVKMLSRELVQKVGSELIQADRCAMRLVDSNWCDAMTPLCGPIVVGIKRLSLLSADLVEILSAGRCRFDPLVTGHAQFHEHVIRGRRLTTASVAEGAIKPDYCVFYESDICVFTMKSNDPQAMVFLQRCISIVHTTSARPNVCVILEMFQTNEPSCEEDEEATVREYSDLREVILSTARAHTRNGMKKLGLTVIPFVCNREPGWYTGVSLYTLLANTQGADRDLYRQKAFTMSLDYSADQGGLLMGVVREGVCRVTPGSQISVGPYRMEKYKRVDSLVRGLGCFTLVDREVVSAECFGRKVSYAIPGMAIGLRVIPDKRSVRGTGSNAGIPSRGGVLTETNDHRRCMPHKASVLFTMIQNTRAPGRKCKYPLSDNLERQLCQIVHHGTVSLVTLTDVVVCGMEGSAKMYTATLEYVTRAIITDRQTFLFGRDWTAFCDILDIVPVYVPVDHTMQPVNRVGMDTAAGKYLPDEIWLSIFSQLSFRDTLSVGLSCKLFHSLLSDIKDVTGIVVPTVDRLRIRYFERLALRYPELSTLEVPCTLSAEEQDFLPLFFPNLRTLTNTYPWKTLFHCMPSVRHLVTTTLSGVGTFPNVETVTVNREFYVFIHTGCLPPHTLCNPITLILHNLHSVGGRIYLKPYPISTLVLAKEVPDALIAMLANGVPENMTVEFRDVAYVPGEVLSYLNMKNIMHSIR